MDLRPSDLLADAARDLPLPPGAALAFAPVLAVSGEGLPDAIRRAAPRRQAGFAAGRAAAQAALRAAGHGDPAPPDIGADGLPDWPRGWLGSISHSDQIAAALVAPGKGARLLGLDVERIVTAEVAAQIAPDVLPELPPGRAGIPPALEVTQAFSAKEALYKALYPLTRQFRAFSAARVAWSAADPLRLVLALTEDWGPDWPAGTRFEARQSLAAGHVVTVLWRAACVSKPS